MERVQSLIEGTEDVKKFKANTLIEKYELFHVEPNKTLASMQMCFVHLINKLEKIGNSLSNQDCDNKGFKVYVQGIAIESNNH